MAVSGPTREVAEAESIAIRKLMTDREPDYPDFRRKVLQMDALIRARAVHRCSQYDKPLEKDDGKG